VKRLIRPFDFILDATSGWNTLVTENTSTQYDRLQLETREDLLPQLIEPNGTFGGHTLPRGVALWRDKVFIADPLRHRILHWRPCCGPAKPLPTIGGQGNGPRQLDTPLGLAISHRDDLVVVDSKNHRLLLFTLPSLALRRTIGPFSSRRLLAVDEIESASEDFHEVLKAEGLPLWCPVDVAAGPDGLYVADEEGYIWRLDRQGRPDRCYFGRLPDGYRSRRLQVDKQGRAYVIAEAAEPILVILDRYGHLMPSPDGLEPKVNKWLRLHPRHLFFIELTPQLQSDLNDGNISGRLRDAFKQNGDISLSLDATISPVIVGWRWIVVNHGQEYTVQKTENRLSIYGYELSFNEEAEARAALLPKELSELMDLELNRFITRELRRQPTKDKEEIWQEYRHRGYETVLPEAYHAKLPLFLERALPASRLSLLDEELGQRLDAWLREHNLDSSIENRQAAYAALLPDFPDELLTSAVRSKSSRILLGPEASQPCWLRPQLTDLTVDEEGHLDLDDLPARPYLLHRPPVATFHAGGLYRFEPLDSERLGNPWHRVVLELDVPERSGVRLFSFTSDVLRPDLDAGGLLAEPPRLGQWQAAPDNAHEWLIQSPPGRYLYLALVLKGPGDRTPSVERLYVYARRQSSLQYLPAVYQEDETSRHLLDRFLSLSDTIFGEIESAIEDFPVHLDAIGAPAGFLPWLASWFNLMLEQSWNEAQRRAFLKNVVELYRKRGTVRGLKLLLRLHAGLKEPMPQIVEHFRDTADSLQDWLGRLPDAPHHFSVLLPATAIDTPEKRAAIERLIDAFKPAHTHYALRPVHAGLRLGSCGSALGLDSLLASHSPWRLPGDAEDDGILGARTLLPKAPTPRAVAVRLGYTRLGAPDLGCRHCAPCKQ
jgi:phage tail-like protein